MAYIEARALNALWREANDMTDLREVQIAHTEDLNLLEFINELPPPSGPDCLCGCSPGLHGDNGKGMCHGDGKYGMKDHGGCKCSQYSHGREPEYIAGIHRGRVVFNDDDEVCGFCNKPGADKIPAPLQYENQYDAGSKYVHAECEREEEERCSETVWERNRWEDRERARRRAVDEHHRR